MKKIFLLLAAFLISFMAGTGAYAQEGDVALAFGTTAAPTSNFSSSGFFTQGQGGGFYFGFNGDVLIRHHLGVEAEVDWKTSQGLYGGQLPYRPIFIDFNGIYSRRFSKFVGAEALAGIGVEDVRFYSSAFTQCDAFGNCSNFQSSHHFMADLGGGIRLYAYHNFFVRPEVRLYLIHNNVEFSSGHVVRYGASIGYTFGGTH